MSKGEETLAVTGWTQAGRGFEEVFLTHYRRIVLVLFHLLGDRTRADELANEVFWKVYRRFSWSAPNSNVAGWLYRVATNLGIEELRAAGRRQRYERAAGQVIRDADSATTPLDDLLLVEKRARVHAVLASLKGWQAQILTLRSIGLSYEELADALRMKRSSVGTMLARAEAEFGKRYSQMHGGEE
jgi:RNA polymerase sigma-70 factor (ECF subfamily)